MKKTFVAPYLFEFLLLCATLLVVPSFAKAETVQIPASSGDGAVTSSGLANWHVVRTNGNSLSVGATASESNVYTDNSYAIRRLYFPFDTSSIPFGAQITSATLHLTHPHNNHLDNGLNAGLIIGNQSSLTSLTTSDWAPNSFVRIADDIDMTTFSSTDQAISYELGEIGRGSIQKGVGGITSIILATSADIDSNPVSSGSFVDVYMSETSGTSKDPYLEVTYVNGTTTEPTDLKVNGQTSPQTLTDATPDLTFDYESFNGVGKATHYQILLSTSSSDWSGSALQWDSKKSPFGQAVASGTTSPAVTFSGSLIADTTYYWKVRIWDEYANISDWSSTANFQTDDTLTIRIYSEAGDGAITSGGSTSWSNAKSGTSLEPVNYTASESNVYTDNSYAIRRLYFPFDTSTLPSDAIVSAATLNLVHPHNNHLNNGLSVGLIEGSVSDINALSTSDWGSVTFDRLSSDKTISSFSSSNQTIQWTLNATGTSAINLGSGASTTLVVATSADIDNNSGAVTGGNYTDFNMSESAYPPYLEVTYSR